MGEVVKSQNNARYYKVRNGGIVRDVNDGEPGSVQITITNPKTGIETKKSVIPIYALEGVISSLEIKEEEMDGVKWKKIILKMKDGNETLQIESKFKSQHGLSLINRLCQFVKLDLKKTPISLGAYKIKDKDKDRYNQGFYIHYGDEKLGNLWSKENMPKETEWVDKVINGETVKDKTKYLKFFLEQAEKVVIPYFKNLKDIVQESIPDEFEDDTVF